MGETGGPPCPDCPEVRERYRALIEFMIQLGTTGIRQWRRRQLRYWRRQARRLEGKRQEWVKHMPEHAKAVAGHLHLPLLEKMIQATGHPDADLVADFRRGSAGARTAGSADSRQLVHAGMAFGLGIRSLGLVRAPRTGVYQLEMGGA